MRVPLKFGIVGVAIRAGIGGLFIAMQASTPEGSMAVLLDLPTLVVYWLLGLVGVHLHIVDTHDLRFFLIGLLVWGATAAAIGWFMQRSSRRARARDSSEGTVGS
jgi:hypothetical protein